MLEKIITIKERATDINVLEYGIDKDHKMIQKVKKRRMLF